MTYAKTTLERIFKVMLMLIAFSVTANAGSIYVVTKSKNPQWKAYDSTTPCGDAADFERFAPLWKADQEKPQRMASWNLRCTINKEEKIVTCVNSAGTTQKMFWFETEAACSKARKAVGAAK